MFDYDNQRKDLDDCERLRELNEKYAKAITDLNTFIQVEGELLILIIDAISPLNFSDKLSFFNQLMKLSKAHPIGKSLVSDYHVNSSRLKQVRNMCKQIEEQIKCEKKIFDATPK